MHHNLRSMFGVNVWRAEDSPWQDMPCLDDAAVAAVLKLYAFGGLRTHRSGLRLSTGGSGKHCCQIYTAAGLVRVIQLC